MKLHIYASVTTGISKTRARGATRPLIELLSEQIDYPIEFDFRDGEQAEDLLAFGKDLHEGKVHIGVVWGIEYGWLQQRFDTLQPLVISSLGSGFHNAARLMVRKNGDVPKLDDLRGRTLVRVRRTPLVNRLYLQKLMDEKGEDFLSFEPSPRGTTKAALLAVRNDQEKKLAVLIDFYSLLRFGESQPKLAADLVAVERSSLSPVPALIASPDQLRKLRPDLWHCTQQRLLEIHGSAEGRQLISFWRFDRFREPDTEFHELVEKSTAEYVKYLFKY